MVGQFGADFTGLFSFNSLISNYFNDQGCSPFYFGCTENWSGTFSGGTVSFVAYNATGVEYFFTGAITDGSFSGGMACPFDEAFCLWSQRATFDFTSTWTNGWRSDGALLVDSSSPPISVGTLSMTTVTPEPGSMMLVGLGIAAIGTFIRGRPGNPRLLSRRKMQYG